MTKLAATTWQCLLGVGIALTSPVRSYWITHGNLL